MSRSPVGRNAVTQLLNDRYRCGDDAAEFVVASQLLPETGYFRFGEAAICYGQCAARAAHQSAEGPLPDVLDQVVIDDSKVLLPFDPEQVIDGLRGERYRKTVSGLKDWPADDLIRSAYYLVRPLMPVPIRKYLQKFYLRGWQNIPFPRWPVDLTVEHIHEALLVLALKAREGTPIPFIWFWPNAAPSCAVVTHDVETESGLSLCSRLMDLNDSFGVKASFQIVPEERYRVRESLLAEIRGRGFEVNVHDLNHDGHLFRDRTEFLRRAKLINRYIGAFGAQGFRSAVLYRNTSWYDALDVSYDMSVPNVAHLDPQQGGCCTVLPYFIGNIVELPVTMTQDYSLFQILGDYSTDLWLEQSRRIRQKNGLLNAIIHPDYVFGKKARLIYEGMLAHLAELRSTGQTWIALPREVADWWRQRRGLSLVPQGDSWRIEGEGNERASLAYAVLEGDSVRYRLAPSPGQYFSAFGS
jgi:hypothetical protein